MQYNYAKLAQDRELKLMELGLKPILSAQDHEEAMAMKSVDVAAQQEAAETAVENEPKQE